MARRSPLHPDPPSRLILGLLAAATLCLGLAMWLHLGSIEFVDGWQRTLLIPAVALAVLAALVPPRPWRRLRGVRRFSPVARRWTTVGVGLVGAIATVGIWWFQQGDPRPSVCDEYSYLIQAQMLSRGHVAGPAHALPGFFTTFQLVAEPAYGSIYLPGTALWLAPWAWLDRVAGDGTGALVWPAPLLATAVALGLTYRLVAELLDDDRLGLLAAAIAFCVPMLRASGTMLVGQSVATMFALVIVYAFLKWRRAARAGTTRWALAWALVAGGAVSWGLLSRPMDVLAYAMVPLALVVLPLALGRAVDGVAWRTRLLSTLVAPLAAVPFLLVALPLNKAMTGSPLTTSFSWYAENYLPGTSYGLNAPRPLDAVPLNDNANFQLSYRSFTRRFIRDHATLPPLEVLKKRAALQTVVATPHALMLALAASPLLLIVLRPGRWRFALLLALPWVLAALLYLPYGFYLGQYAVATAPSMAASIVAGVPAFAIVAGRLLRRGRLPSRRASVGTAALLSLGLLALSTRGVPGLANLPREDWYQVPELRRVDNLLRDATEPPAVVFITPPSMRQPLEAESVYNLNVLSPDHADVVRAHDRGAENVELVRYYAQRQPGRRVYHYDAAERLLIELGPAGELVATPEATAEFAERFERLSAWWRAEYGRQLSDGEAGDWALGAYVPGP